MACWLCGIRSEGQIAIRPGGKSDGRRVCRSCVRRMVVWIQNAQAQARVDDLVPVWPQAALTPTGDPLSDQVRSMVGGAVFPALGAGEDADRALVAISYLELGLQHEALLALGQIRPEALDAGALPERTLTSLLSRLLDSRDLAAGAREVLAAAVSG